MLLNKARGMAGAMTAINVLVSCGFSFTGVWAPRAVLPVSAVVTEAARIFALYAAVRAAALAVVCLVVIARRNVGALLVLGMLAGLIQLLDCAVGVVQHDPGKIAGPLVIAAAQFWTLLNLKRAVADSERMSNGPDSILR